MSNLLKEYLSEILTEKEQKPARTINDALDMGLALYEIVEGFYILYDAKNFLRALNDESVNLFDVIYGILGVDVHSGDCNGAGEIKSVAGQKGYGKMMYAIAATISPNGIFSDRSLVSKDAQNFWKKNVTNNVEGEPFDDESNPKTPPKQDDCELKHTKWGANHPLDKSYKLNANVNIGELKSRHEKVMKVVHHVKHTRKEAEEKLRNMRYDFFEARTANASFT
jgi:hypothetical protein